MFRKTNIFYPLIRTRTCTHQRVRNFGFSKNFANLLIESALVVVLIFINHKVGSLTFFLSLALTIKYLLFLQVIESL